MIKQQTYALQSALHRQETMSAYLSVPNSVAHARVQSTVLLVQATSTSQQIIPVAVPAR